MDNFICKEIFVKNMEISNGELVGLVGLIGMLIIFVLVGTGHIY
jgi:hypothetical protein